jgi:hypothetical protein
VERNDFLIGTEFYTESGKWRCTDIGTRTIIAINLEPHNIVSVDMGTGLETRSATDDSAWLKGPPYAIPEEVFDEDDIKGCYLSKDEL